MGFYLLHESMLDSVILAREKHLSDDGIVLPSHAKILAAPVQLDSWVEEQFNSWREVYGFNMTPMAQRAMEIRLERGQPEVYKLEEQWRSVQCSPCTKCKGKQTKGKGK